MSRVSKNDRVLLLIVLMAASSLGVGGAVYGITSGESAVLDAEREDLQRLRLNADDLSSSVYTQEAALDDYVLSGDRVARHRFDVSGDRAQNITTLVSAGDGLPHVRAAFARVDAAVDAWRQDVAGPVLAAVATNDRDALAEFRSRTANDHLAIEAALNALTAEMNTAAAEFADRQASVAATNLVGIAIAFGFVLMAFSVALVAVRRFGKALELDARQASVLNKFTEMTSFADDDKAIAAANLVALTRLAGPDGSVTHILNRSMDRAVPEASTGNAVAEILPMHALGRCAGVQRGTMYVNDNLAEELSVHCPIYPATSGTLACIPLISGESVGAVHLYWHRPQALPLASRSNIARITEHAALAIGNQRLLAALHGQANTDPRTGLANSRAFDLTVEEALKARKPEETVSILMIDVDHFKDFNDNHGHPAGTRPSGSSAPSFAPASVKGTSPPATVARSSRSCSAAPVTSPMLRPPSPSGSGRARRPRSSPCRRASPTGSRSPSGSPTHPRTAWIVSASWEPPTRPSTEPRSVVATASSAGLPSRTRRAMAWTISDRRPGIGSGCRRPQRRLQPTDEGWSGRPGERSVRGRRSAPGPRRDSWSCPCSGRAASNPRSEPRSDRAWPVTNPGAWPRSVASHRPRPACRRPAAPSR